MLFDQLAVRSWNYLFNYFHPLCGRAFPPTESTAIVLGCGHMLQGVRVVLPNVFNPSAAFSMFLFHAFLNMNPSSSRPIRHRAALSNHLAKESVTIVKDQTPHFHSERCVAVLELIAARCRSSCGPCKLYFLLPHAFERAVNALQNGLCAR